MVDDILVVEGQTILVFFFYGYFIITSRTQEINFVCYGTLLWHTCPFYLLICFETDYYQLEWVMIQ
jgi:hypothetical protein